MTRMCLNNEPYFSGESETERFSGGESEMNFHFDSTVHTRGNDNVAAFESDEFSRQHVPSAQPVGWLVREKNVPGPNAQAITANCLSCHSAGMVLTQPGLSKATWDGIVEKMIHTYKAPIGQNEVPAIDAYLQATKGAK